MPNNPDRVRVSSYEAAMQMQMDKKEWEAATPRDFVDYTPKLYKSLAMPSYVHGYSLAIEFMKQWFLEYFPKDFFKVVHINGKHVLDDWKHFNNYNIVRVPPMLAIVPTVEYEYDRDGIDLYLGDHNMLLKKTRYQQSFFRDYNNKNFLYMQMRALRMNFNFKVRVATRAQQLDVYNNMNMWFRIGATQERRVAADFHIPYDIICNMASVVGFDLDQYGNIKEEDCLKLTNYLNQYSDLPIMYKMRAINQKPEFFVRVRNMYTHIDTQDRLDIDDGEMIGKLGKNYHIEMRAVLTIPIPHFFVYFNQDPIVKTITVKERDKDCIGLYTINPMEILPYNEKGWNSILITEYLLEPDEEFIDLSKVLFNKNFEPSMELKKVYDATLANGFNPETFLDIRLWRSEDVARVIEFTMDWEHCILQLNKTLDESHPEMISIAIYGDKRYINETVVTLEKYDASRISVDENPNAKVTPHPREGQL